MKTEKLVILINITFTIFSFFIGLYFINPVLHYHNQQIAWHSSEIFFNHFLTFPGGLGEYLSLFISQWFVYKYVGSCIIALSGFLISYFVLKIVSLRWKWDNLLILLIPIIQVLNVALFFDYRYHYSVTLNLVIVSFCLLYVTHIDKKWNSSTVIVAPLTGIVIYIFSGGMFFLIFMIASIVLFVKNSFKQSVLFAFVIVSVTLIVPYVAYKYVYLVSLKFAYLKSVPNVAVMLRYSEPMLYQLLLIFIPAIILLLKISTFFRIAKKGNTSTGLSVNKKPKRQTGFWKTKGRIVAVGLQLLLLLAVSIAIIRYEYNPIEKAKIEIDYQAYQQNWERVIELSLELEEYDRMVNFHYNRALLNTGQVLDKVFEYPQRLGTLGLFLDVPFTAEITLPNSDLYFDLGNIDESQRYAFESETLMKNSPRVLKRLILNCIILDKMEAAKTYLNILESNPIEKSWAQQYISLANDRKLAAEDPLIKKKREELSKAEGMKVTPPLKLLHQLQKNPNNKKAVEYLITSDLMEHDLVSLKEDFKYLKQFNYSQLPVSIEEAVILYRSQNRENEFLNNIRISSSTTARFREFAKLTKASGGDREKAKIATKAFERTYWYYALFISPRVTKVKLSTTPVDTNY